MRSVSSVCQDVYLIVFIYPFCLTCISALDAKLGQQQWWDTRGRGWRGALWEKTARRSRHVGEVHRGRWRLIAVERIGNVSWSFPTGVLVEQIYSEYFAIKEDNNATLVHSCLQSAVLLRRGFVREQLEHRAPYQRSTACSTCDPDGQA